MWHLDSLLKKLLEKRAAEQIAFALGFPAVFDASVKIFFLRLFAKLRCDGWALDRLSALPTCQRAVSGRKMDEQTRKAVAEAIPSYGSRRHTIAAGPMLDVLTLLARSGDLSSFAEAFAAFKAAIPEAARTLQDYAPAKILSEYLCRQPGVDTTKAERFRAKDPDWAQRLANSISSPVRLTAVTEDMLAELRRV